MVKFDLDTTANVLAGVGAANWGLVEFMDTNLVATVAGYVPQFPVATVLYGAVAASGLYVLAKALGLMK